MEYLMTYGWAILIIAVVLGALYSLGLFSGSTLGPRTAPSSCQVIRPNGPLSTTYISLAGTCTRGLPQYVAVFNGANSYYNASYSPRYDSPSLTVSAWFTSPTPAANQNIVGNFGDCTTGAQGNGWRLNLRAAGGIWFSIGYFNNDNGDATTPNTILPNKWYNVVGVLNGGATVLYLNGVQVGSGTTTATINSIAPLTIGVSGGCSGLAEFISGKIANVQFYNSSFDANQVASLYTTGIGGAPTSLQSLVGWWPPKREWQRLFREPLPNTAQQHHIHQPVVIRLLAALTPLIFYQVQRRDSYKYF